MKEIKLTVVFTTAYTSSHEKDTGEVVTKRMLMHKLAQAGLISRKNDATGVFTAQITKVELKDL